MKSRTILIVGVCLIISLCSHDSLEAQAITAEDYIYVVSPLNSGFRTSIYPSSIYQSAIGASVKTTILSTTPDNFTISTSAPTLRFVADYNPIAGPLATWYFKASSGFDTEVMTLSKEGDLNIKTLANIGDYKNMQYNDATGQVGWDNSSRRYKTNISTLHDDWSKILNARPVKYSRPASPDHWEYGYIAEEMDSIGLANLVGYDKDGIPDDVKYDRVVLYLTELVKQQRQEINQLHSTLSASCLKQEEIEHKFENQLVLLAKEVFTLRGQNTTELLQVGKK